MSNQRLSKLPTPERLANAALHYLARYAASEASLRRVLDNKIRRAAMRDEAFAADHDKQKKLRDSIDKIVEAHKRTGAINDAAFAETKVRSLRRVGRSARRIEQSLTQKGVKKADIQNALSPEEGEDAHEAELRAAMALARRRAVGPYRKKPRSNDPQEAMKEKAKEVATLARAGFSFDIIKKVFNESIEEESYN